MTAPEEPNPSDVGMTNIQVLRGADRVAMPWKNGSGVTHEVVVFPRGAGMDNFQWRLSMAEVSEPSPFSSFAGIDRVLAVLEGRLRLSGSVDTIELTATSPPLAFPGDAAIYGEPLDGPVLDLNAMAPARGLSRGNEGIGRGQSPRRSALRDSCRP